MDTLINLFVKIDNNTTLENPIKDSPKVRNKVRDCNYSNDYYGDQVCVDNGINDSL